MQIYISECYILYLRWEDVDAIVVCRQLGFAGGEALGLAEFGEGSGNILMDSVECNGEESDIAQCTRNPWGVHDCSHREDASVRCGKFSQSSRDTNFLLLRPTRLGPC